MSEELKKKLDELGQAIEASQQSLEKGLKETSANAASEVTKIAQQLQDQEQKLKALEEGSKFLEKQLSKGVKTEVAEEFDSEYREQMTKYLRKGHAIESDLVENVCKSIVNDSLIGVSKDQKEAISKSLFAGNDPSAGYFIRPQLASTMISRIFETSPIRSFANVVSTNTDSLEFIIDDNQFTSGGWVSELEARPTTDNATIGKLTIPVHEQYANPKATQKMLDDAGFDIEAWISRKVVDRISRDENTAFVKGDGSQKPRGFLTYPDYTAPQKADAFGAYGRGAIEQIVSGSSGNITGDGLKDLQNSLKEDYQANAIWGIRRKNFEQVITLKDSQGRYIFDTRFLQESRTLMLLGKQVVFMNDLPDAAPDSLSMVYGDFSVGYTIVDRLGFRVIRDIYTSKPFVQFYTTKRVGGDVTNYEALKLLKLSA
jgi:HK97 family phage major capsid protein